METTNQTPSKFVIVSEARCGSNYLVDLLAGHPKVMCLEEIFHRTQIHSSRHIEKEFTIKERDLDPDKFIHEVFSSEKAKKKTHHGFKLISAQSPDMVTFIANRPEYKIIFLTREDKIAQYSSRKIAGQTNEWLKLKQDSGDPTHEAPSFPKTTFKLSEYILFLIQSYIHMTYYNRITEQKDTTCLHLTYEDITLRDGLNRVLSFLELSTDYSLKSKMIKQNASKTIDRFDNAKKIKGLYNIYDKTIPRIVRFCCLISLKIFRVKPIVGGLRIFGKNVVIQRKQS
jgi:LPS sulfotransferase NodH